MKKVEITLILLCIVAAVANLLFAPHGAILVVLSFGCLISLYQWFGFVIFNNIPLRGIFKPESYRGIAALKITGAIVAGIVLSLTVLGILFKFMSWGGANLMLMEGLVLSVIVLIVAAIRYFRNKSPYYLRVFMRLGVAALIAILLMQLPKGFFTEIKFRHYPAYVEAYKKWQADPMNEALRKKMEDEREKTTK